MKILLLSHYYWPEVGAPQRRWATLVSHFVRQGHQVVVAAPHPHYPHSRRDEFFGSAVGRFRTRVDAKLGGTWELGELGERIIRVPYLHSGSSMARQLLDQGVASAGAVNAIIRRMGGPYAPDVVISTTPALPFLFAGDAVARALRVPHIAEVRDVWPDLISDLSLVKNAVGKYLPRAATAYLEEKVLPGLLTLVQRRASAVVVTTESFRYLLERRGIRSEVVRSGVGQSEIDQLPHRCTVADCDRKLLYVGTVGRSQDLSSAIAAASRVPGIKLRIVGDGADRANLETLARTLGAPVEFFEQTTGQALAEHWEWADVGLVSLGDVPAHALTVPSKLYSLMARRVPILGIVAGEAAEIISENRAGVVARPGDVDSIVTALQALVQGVKSPDSVGHEWVVNHASVDVMGAEYDRILERVRP
ncbi:glycosyltransferase family 4 protein [Brevibacterium sp. 'Marine']|uniref:glycosyltransferase family 4 protein n=1 Tax=Brevibacterium sp. 'Marine' TaxID=2725563 RepID=UPI00145CE5D4|nr:glycosyltransferase family 4 protein [Brevibacterium sp. 'Marine']